MMSRANIQEWILCLHHASVPYGAIAMRSQTNKLSPRGNRRRSMILQESLLRMKLCMVVFIHRLFHRMFGGPAREFFIYLYMYLSRGRRRAHRGHSVLSFLSGSPVFFLPGHQLAHCPKSSCSPQAPISTSTSYALRSHTPAVLL